MHRRPQLPPLPAFSLHRQARIVKVGLTVDLHITDRCPLPPLPASPLHIQARIVKVGLTVDLHSLGLVAKSSVYELFNITLQRVAATILQTPGEYSVSGREGGGGRQRRGEWGGFVFFLR